MGSLRISFGFALSIMFGGLAHAAPPDECIDELGKLIACPPGAESSELREPGQQTSQSPDPREEYEAEPGDRPCDSCSSGALVVFQEATQLFEEGAHEAAAERYLNFVDQTPDDPSADLALYNAAVAYEITDRFEHASSVYERIYRSYERCTPARLDAGERCSELVDHALLRAGLCHERIFELESALTTYLLIISNADDLDSEPRAAALHGAARLNELLQHYEDSAKLYGELAERAARIGWPEGQGEALYRAAEVLAKASDPNAAIAAYQKYLEAAQALPDRALREVEAHLRLGQLYRDIKERKHAELEFEAVIERFTAHGLQSGTAEAALPAEAQFRLAEYQLEDLKRMRITAKTSSSIETETQNLFDELIRVASEHDKVFNYRSLDWILAAMYGRGLAFETVAGLITDAPVPKRLSKGSSAYKNYVAMNRIEVQPLIEKALSLYKECSKRSVEFQSMNAWVPRARERLTVHERHEYPARHDAALTLVVEDRR